MGAPPSAFSTSIRKIWNAILFSPRRMRGFVNSGFVNSGSKFCSKFGCCVATFRFFYAVFLKPFRECQRHLRTH
jgi:hypothetical protein